jgi:PhnB protein
MGFGRCPRAIVRSRRGSSRGTRLGCSISSRRRSALRRSPGHAEFRIGNSIVMAFDAKEGWPDTPGFFRLYVEDGDAVYRRALEAGAVSVTEMTHLFFGDRVGRVRDPQCNVWWIQSRVEEVDAEEMEKRAGEQGYVDAMRYVQESLDRELGSRSRR